MFFSNFFLDLQFFAQKKGGGSASTNCNHDSKSKRLGVKVFGGERIRCGSIIVRQRGSHFKCGSGVYFGKDFSIHAKFDGFVFFKKKAKNRTFVNVSPLLEK